MNARQLPWLILAVFGAALVFWSGYFLVAALMDRSTQAYQTIEMPPTGKCLTTDKDGNFRTIDCPHD